MVLLFLAVLAIMAMTLFDILSRDPALVRLPKPLWAILVILMPLLGCALWFLIGRRTEPSTATRTIVVRESPTGPATAPETTIGPRRPGPLSTEEQLAALELEIEEDRRFRRIVELEDELRRRRGEPESDPA